MGERGPILLTSFALEFDADATLSRLRSASESSRPMSMHTATLDESIQAHLAQILDGLPTVPSWYDDWMVLGSQSSEEDRLKVYQAVRDSGVLPDEASFFLIAWQVELLAALRAETALHPLDLRIQACDPESGLRGDPEEQPEVAAPEYNRLMEQYFAARDQIFIETLLQYGEHEISLLFQEDRKAFEDRNEAGRAYFRKTPEPRWVSELVLAVRESADSNDSLSPLGAHLQKTEGGWDVIVFPEWVELVGGPADGAVVSLGFTIDVRRLQLFFDRIDSIGWSARGCFVEEPSLMVKGVRDGIEICLRVLDEPSEGEACCWKFDVIGQPRIRRSAGAHADESD